LERCSQLKRPPDGLGACGAVALAAKSCPKAVEKVLAASNAEKRIIVFLISV
jgi:hypothetical protein